MLTAPACAPFGGLEGVSAPRGRGAVIQGEVRSIDRRRNYLEIREGLGRSRSVRYDNRTRVVDGRRQYSVNALDRGDRVRIWIAYDRRGAPWVDRIERYSSTVDRRVAIPRMERLDGVVGQLDSRRNYFTITRNRYQSVIVRVPNRLQRDDARRMQRLRRGDRVRVDVRPLDRNTVELIRFR
jgi:hypothetical protein